MAFFTQGPHRHYYYDAGAGSPVLLLHGLGNSGRAWMPQVSALLGLGHRVIVPDLLGHGASSQAPEGITAHAQALQMLALLDHLGLESTHVIGLSLGGMVALEMACHAPHAVQKLIVAGTFAHMNDRHRQATLSDWADGLRQTDGCSKRFKSTWPALVGAEFAASSRGQRLYQAWPRPRSWPPPTRCTGARACSSTTSGSSCRRSRPRPWCWRPQATSSVRVRKPSF